jgi:GNAT superfamily N-acetyltransferase
MSDLNIRRLEADEQRPSFDCGDADLNEFYAVDSIHNAQNLLSVTYVVERGSEVIAFFSLSNDSIRKEKLKQDMLQRVAQAVRLKQKSYASLPAVKIGRLATSSNTQGQGVGSEIIDYIKFWFTTGNKTGCRFIVVDAYNNPKTINFYEKNDFSFLQHSDANKNTRLMFFDLKMI